MAKKKVHRFGAPRELTEDQINEVLALCCTTTFANPANIPTLTTEQVLLYAFIDDELGDHLYFFHYMWDILSEYEDRNHPHEWAYQRLANRLCPLVEFALKTQTK